MGRSSKRGQYLIYIAAFMVLAVLLYLRLRSSAVEAFQEKQVPKGIILQLIGGIGNQLYIYTAGKIMQKELNVPIYLTVDNLSVFYHSQVDYRPLLFSDFEAINNDNPILNDKNDKIDARLQQAFWDPWSLGSLPSTDKYIHISSHWYQHIPSIEKGIPEVRDKITHIMRERYSDSVVEPGSAFIHVRRGDYLNEGNKVYALDNEYYSKGLMYLNKIDTIKNIYVFSDDIEWCKGQGWTSHKRFIYIDDPDELKTLYMMSQCTEGAIISNSTFSTWGVLLGTSTNRVIVYPSKWLYGAETAFPPSWIRI